MKKIIPLLIIMLLIVGCSQADRESLDELYDAFERKHEELESEFSTLFEEIEESGDRETQLKVIYEEALPAIEDFRRTIHNYTVTGREHEQLKEHMLTYIDSLETLIELNGRFNRTFISYNPLSDERFIDEIEVQLEEIESQEALVEERYEEIHEQYESLTEDSAQ